MPSPPAVTVVCVTYNSAQLLEGFVTALHAGMAGVADWDLIGVDNASDDDSAVQLRVLHPAATVLQAPDNGGFAAGVNLALERIDGDRAVLVVNPDARLHRGSVARLLEEVAQPHVGIAAPRILDPDGTTNPSLHRDPTVLRMLGAAVLGDRRAGRIGALGEVMVGDRVYDHPQDVAWASGAVLLFAPGLVERIGPLDESFFLYSEETEFAMRARDAGFLVRYRPDAAATHLGGDAHRRPRLYRMLVANKVRLFARRHPRWQTQLYRDAMILHQRIRARRGSSIARHGLAELRHPSLLDG